MSRDHRKLRVFALADAATVGVYRLPARFPPEERFGLQTQLRRAAVSAAANIVEGSARRSISEYLNFLNISAGSAAEARYLLDLSVRLGFAAEDCVKPLLAQYASLSAGLESLIRSLEPEESPYRKRRALQPESSASTARQALSPEP
jgi:four helix bundle protein